MFTARDAIDYQSPDDEGVCYFFVTIGPPRERQTHLHLLALVSTLVLKTDQLALLRNAEDADAILAALHEAEEQLAVKQLEAG